MKQNQKDIETVKHLSKKELDKKIEIINRSELIDIPVTLLPGVHSEEYYFISYSHKDYKLVYADLFKLENSGFEFWYDRGIPAGSNWLDVANKYIAPYACKGVIFYISENSLSSDSVYDEMAFVKKLNKPFACIHLPISIDYEYNNEKVKGRVFSIRKILEIMRLNGESLNAEKIEKIEAMFPEEILYLDYALPPETKMEKIEAIIPEQPLLLYDKSSHMIIGAVDSNVISIDEKDFFYHLSKRVKEPKRPRPFVALGYCAFANMHLLENVSLPCNYSFGVLNDCFSNCFNLKNINGLVITHDVYEGTFRNCYSLEKPPISYPSMETINDEAFCGCKSLIFNFRKCTQLISIGKRAFDCCENLKIVDLPNSLKKIDNAAFRGCKNLRRVRLGRLNEMAPNAFIYCPNIVSFEVSEMNTSFRTENGILYDRYFEKLVLYPTSRTTFKIDDEVTTIGAYAGNSMSRIKKIVIPNHISVIGQYAFSSCSILEEVYIPESVTTIDEQAFCSCPNLKKVVLPKSIKRFSYGAFSRCPKLKEVIFNGSINDLENCRDVYYFLHMNKITKVIHCSDGDFALK